MTIYFSFITMLTLPMLALALFGDVPGFVTVPFAGIFGWSVYELVTYFIDELRAHRSRSTGRA